MNRMDWQPWMIEHIKKFYEIDPNHELQKTLGCSYNALTRKAKELGLKKPNRQFKPGQRPSPGTEFKKGHVPWSKGTKGKSGIHPNVVATQFKKGRKPHEASNYLPIGSLRITQDKILERKWTDDQSLYPAARWKPVTRLVWEAAHGPIPAGHAVAFRDPSLHTTVESEITIDKLMLLSLAENMRRNNMYLKYPPELIELIQLSGRLTRQINHQNKGATS